MRGAEVQWEELKSHRALWISTSWVADTKHVVTALTHTACIEPWHIRGWGIAWEWQIQHILKHLDTFTFWIQPTTNTSVGRAHGQLKSTWVHAQQRYGFPTTDLIYVPEREPISVISYANTTHIPDRAATATSVVLVTWYWWSVNIDKIYCLVDDFDV